MTNNELADAIKDLSLEVREIKTSLDELTGIKKFLMGLTGFIGGMLALIATWIGVHHK